MTKLQKLTEFIQKTVPEIMELKFGCKLLNKEIGVIFTVYQEIGKHKFGGGYLRTELGEIELDYLENYKILGRDITLEDVLITLQRTYHNSSKEVDWVSMVRKWKILNPLHEQSEETINFLHSIIVNN